MTPSKRVLITGASGFVGTWLAELLVQQGFNVVGVDIQHPVKPCIWESFAVASVDAVDFDGLLQHKPIDAICHLAGSASVPASVTNPYGDFASLLPGTARLALFLARKAPDAHFLLFSSAAVYGNPCRLPITELMQKAPISPYGVHKSIAEELLLQYARLYNLKITVLRIFSLFGPYLRKQLVWDICQQALTAFKMGTSAITLHGTGNESRDFMYIKDLCIAVLALLNNSSRASSEIINVGSGKETTIREVADQLVQHLGLNLNVTFNGQVRPGDPVNWRADISKLQQLNYQPRFGLLAGLKESAYWARSVAASYASGHEQPKHLLQPNYLFQ